MTQPSTRLAPAAGIAVWEGIRQTAALFRPSPRCAYALRVALAVAMAIYAAYWLELDSPYSAGTTVLVLMSASRGAVISKSVWRLGGSIVGAAAAVVLIALFAQTPVLFVLGLAVWVGFCAAIASLLRYNRSYGVVLAGYTVTLVAFGAIADPDRIFDLATARVAVVTIGVISTALVFLVTDSGPQQPQLEKRITGLVRRTASLLRDGLRSGDIGSAILACTGLAADLSALDQVVEFASVEDAGLGRFAGDLRFAVAELFAALLGGLHLIVLARHTDHGVDTALTDALADMADPAPERSAATLRRAILATRDTLAGRAETCRDIAALATLDQAVTLLTQFAGTLGSLQALQEGKPRRAPTRIRNYVNFVTAWRNFLRTVLAITIAGVFWIATAWSDGSSMLVLLGPICALASQTDSAARATVDFLKGTTLAVIGAFICTYGLLPQVTGFPLLMAAMLPFIAVGAYFGTQPRYAIISLGFLVFFLILVAPGNPMRYDLAESLNTYVAFLMGSLAAVIAFRVVLPPNRRAEALVLARSVRNDVRRLIRSRRAPHAIVWEHLQHQKLVRLSARLAEDPAQRIHALDSGAAAVIVGRHILRLRQAATDAALPAPARAAAARTVASFRRLCAVPVETAATARTEAAALASPEAPQPALHIAAMLHDLAELVDDHAGFFTHAPLQWEHPR